MQKAFEHADIFPVIDRLICADHARTGQPVGSKQLRRSLAEDTVGCRLIEEARLVKPEWSETRFANNMVAWFSKEYTDGSAYVRRFERIRLHGEYAYTPRHGAAPSVMPGVASPAPKQEHRHLIF
jgi:hypothetical protein